MVQRFTLWRSPRVLELPDDLVCRLNHPVVFAHELPLRLCTVYVGAPQFAALWERLVLHAVTEQSLHVVQEVLLRGVQSRDEVRVEPPPGRRVKSELVHDVDERQFGALGLVREAEHLVRLRIPDLDLEPVNLLNNLASARNDGGASRVAASAPHILLLYNKFSLI